MFKTALGREGIWMKRGKGRGEGGRLKSKRTETVKREETQDTRRREKEFRGKTTSAGKLWRLVCLTLAGHSQGSLGMAK
jgi:hypothetical protein